MGQELVDFSAFYSRLRVGGMLCLETAMRIGAGGGGGAIEQDLPVLKDLVGRPYIPGSSFKGAYRAHLEALLRGIGENKNLACLSTDTGARFSDKPNAVPGCLSQGDIDELKDRYGDDPAELSKRILERSCWTCRLCGAPWLASKLMVRDMPVVDETWFDRYLIRDGVAIDRDTETVGQGLKFDYEAVPAGTAFRFEMVVENGTKAELGLALLGLREFEDGFVTLGGGRSRGLGQVNLEVDWERATLVTRDNLRAYLLDRKAVESALADEAQRREYWQAFLDAIGEGGSEDA